MVMPLLHRNVSPRTSAAYSAAFDKHLARLVSALEDEPLRGARVIPWSSPVPAFGNIARAAVATVGLNPSNREFLCNRGAELCGPARRFHTLRSLKLARWSQANQKHVALIRESCDIYFQRNPYDTWFRSLDRLICGTGASYYSSERGACHLDLVPFATMEKWSALPAGHRSSLLHAARGILGSLVAESHIQLLILNGASVVKEVANALRVELGEIPMPSWNLERANGSPVKGFAYAGTIRSISGAALSRSIRVLGYNHNIQSSFGVTLGVRESIASWIANMAHASEP
jgi:hypothetical protein